MKFISVIFVVLFSLNSFGLNDSARNKLISKLDRVYQNLAPGDSSRLAVGLRLADLYSERARLAATEELKSNCTSCTAGTKDRKKALRMYEEAVPRLDEEQLGRVLAQMGHLYEMLGSTGKAVRLYKKVISSSASKAAKAEAHMSIAEVYFKESNFSSAINHYKKVVSTEGARAKGLASYRLAWSKFNTGRVDSAVEGLVDILESPELLSRNSAPGVVNVDEDFQQEVSRDLATFFAKKKVSEGEARKLFKLSTPKTRLENVSYLAKESERLGNDKGAIEIWEFVQEKQTDVVKRLEGYVLLSQLQLRRKDREKALKDYKRALSAWPSAEPKCDPKLCKELRTRLKNFMVDWHKTEKNNPTEMLADGYEAFLETFPGDLEATLWAADVAKKRKDWRVAYNYHGQVVDILKQRPGKSAEVEKSLLARIEIAEMSKDNSMITKALTNYETSSPKKDKLVEVRYQKAKMLYDAGKHKEASIALKEIALSKTPGNKKLKVQAANLALDSLVILKDDTKIEKLATQFASMFPSERKSFSKLARQSVLTQTKALAADNSNVGQAWATLVRADMTGASTVEKKGYYKNKILLAEKLGKYAEARASVDQYLRLKPLNTEEAQFGIGKKAWLSELNLDFPTAFQATKAVRNEKIKPEEKWLKLAMFAELGKLNAQPYYQKYLRTASKDEAVAIVEKFLNDSSNLNRDVAKYERYLAKKPERLGFWKLSTYANRPSPRLAKKILRNKKVAETASGKILKRKLFMRDFGKQNTTVAAHKVNTSSQRKMSKGLKYRIKVLSKLEKVSGRAIDSGDWLSQVVALTALSKESHRFYEELLALPMPNGLSEEEQRQYMSLLSQQAAPYKTKSDEINTKLEEFMGQRKAIDQIITNYKDQKEPIKSLLREDLMLMKIFVKDEVVLAKTDQALEEKPSVRNGLIPDLKSLEMAKNEVRKKPMNMAALENLIKLEQRLDPDSAMVAYLTARKETVKSKKGVL